MAARGTMLVVSGPSGSGKSTICKRILADPRVEFSVSATTRAARTGEIDGRDYHFMDKPRFRSEIERGAFIEWAEVHGNLYGTPHLPMERALAAGKVFLLEIDVQGGAHLKALGLPGVYIFIAPPDLSSLRARLEQRGTDSPEVIERRLAKAQEEMRARERYDHVVVNEDLERTVAEVCRLAGLEAMPRGSVR
ncbi:MAG: guanylate kinase [Planctomycetes bacterium]|nr:guanylate kinase [Planctomycetota bacterium]